MEDKFPWKTFNHPTMGVFLLSALGRVMLIGEGKGPDLQGNAPPAPKPHILAPSPSPAPGRCRAVGLVSTRKGIVCAECPAALWR